MKIGEEVGKLLIFNPFYLSKIELVHNTKFISTCPLANKALFTSEHKEMKYYQPLKWNTQCIELHTSG